MMENKNFYIQTVGQTNNEGFRQSLKNMSKSATTGTKKTLGGKEISVWIVDAEVIKNLLKSPDYRRGKDYEIYVELKNSPEMLRKWPKNSIDKFKKKIISDPDTNEKKERFGKLKKKYGKK